MKKSKRAKGSETAPENPKGQKKLGGKRTRMEGTAKDAPNNVFVRGRKNAQFTQAEKEKYMEKKKLRKGTRSSHAEVQSRLRVGARTQKKMTDYEKCHFRKELMDTAAG